MARETRKVVVLRVALVLMLACCAVDASAEVVRLRIAWGGGARRQWQGTLAVDRGRVSSLVPLGIEADEPGSLWIEENIVHVRQRSGRTYDALDVDVALDDAAGG